MPTRASCALAQGLLGDAHHAEDVAQEALVVGLENGASARRGLRAWLAGVTRNLALMRRRAETRRRRHEAAAVQMGKMNSPDDLAARLETQRRLVEAVQELREPYQSTVVARFYDGLKPKEIARRQSVPVETVRTRLQRAMQMLRKRLDEGHGGDRRTWTLALLPFTLKKGFLPAVGAGAAAGSSVGTAVSVKAAVAVVTIAAIVAVVVVSRGTTGNEAPPTPDTIPPPSLPAPERVREEATPESDGARRGPMDAGEYLRRINAGEGAYGVALEISSLPPGQGRQIALAIFTDIRSWARRHEVQKAFVAAGHPHALSVLDLGTRDESEWVRTAAFEYVQDLFFRNFTSRPQAYREWFSRYGGRPLADALRENAREYVHRLYWLEGEELSRELGRVGLDSARLWGHAGIGFVAVMREAGILELIEGYLGSPDTRSWVVVPAFRWFRELMLDEERMVEIVAPLLAGPAARDGRFLSRMCGELGRSGNTWAVGPLLDLLQGSSDAPAAAYAQAVAALGDIGDERAIPVLIGVISEENANGKVRWQAEWSLIALTGESARDGADEWREWWRKNRGRYPNEVRDQDIPVIRPPR